MSDRKILPKQPNFSIIDGIKCLQGTINSTSPIGVSEIAEITGLDITRVHRLLRTLCFMGFLQQGSGRKYFPGPALPVLAAQILNSMQFSKKIAAPLQLLKKELFPPAHTLALGLLWEKSVTYLYHAKSKSETEVAIGNFEIVPATASGIGMILLSKKSDETIKELFANKNESIPLYPQGLKQLLTALNKIRTQGYAYVKTYTGDHTLAIEVPTFPGAALGISGNWKPSENERLLKILKRGVSEMNLF